MKKEDFLNLLDKAEEDEYGRLYVKGQYDNKVYFGLMTTICEDLFVLDHSEENRDTDELYDRHFWNDDTFKAHVISKHDLSDYDKSTMGFLTYDKKEVEAK